MAQTLGSVAVGSIVKLNENGSPVNYIVVHQGLPSSMYDASCDGTWVLRQAIWKNGKWNNSGANTLVGSTIMATMEDFLSRLDSDMQSAVKTVKIPYCVGNGSSTVNSRANGLECKVFPLGGYEVGFSTNDYDAFPVDGAKLDYFESGSGNSANDKRIAKLNNLATFYHLRSPFTTDKGSVWDIQYDGNRSNGSAQNNYGLRPAFVLPSTLFALDDGTILVSIPAPSTLTVPVQAMQGNQIAVSWSAVDGADGYILERKANTDADWTQVYSGANTSFEETVGTWTSVQYRVKAGVSGTYGDYTTSASVPVVSASAVVISGTDGDLGTLLDDVSYIVASDGTNALNVTEVINGVTTRSYTAVNGGNNVIPVVDLPTGYGTISITASTNPGSGVVSVERNWTYSKGAITFPDEGGVADLSQQGQTIWAKTLAEAVRVPGIWGGNLGLALQKLMGAVLYNPNQVAKYTEVKVSLSGKNEGDIISLPENGQMVEFYVAKLDYESALNGTGRVLLVRKDCYGNRLWDTPGVNAYASSDIDAWYNEDYKTLFPQEIQTAMGTTKFYYTPMNGNISVSTLERSVFSLSLSELGGSLSNVNVEGSALPIADTLKIAHFKGSTSYQWTRSPVTNSPEDAAAVSPNGAPTFTLVVEQLPCRPCFTLPSDFSATYYADFYGNIHEAQEYKEGGSFTRVDGNPISIPRIEAGGYTGTGTYGEDNPTTLTFDFTPYLVIVSGAPSASGMKPALIVMVKGSTTAISLFNKSTLGTSSLDGSLAKVDVTFTDNSVSFYSIGTTEQANITNLPYNYVAIGFAGGDTE